MKDLILMIPGPVWTRPEVLQVMSSAPWGHRDKNSTIPRINKAKEMIRKLLYIDSQEYVILLSTSSGSGLLEGAVRNLAGPDDKILNVSVGAFGDLWYDITKGCAKNVEQMRSDWGKPADLDKIESRLNKGDITILQITHNETSTGVTNPLAEVSSLAKKFDVLLCVDAITSMGGVKIEVEQLGIDFIVGSSQKCLALPPGLAIGSVSPKAMEKIKKVEGRGYYFDFLQFKKSIDKGQTIATPAEAQIDALLFQMEYILEKEGLENRFAKHAKRTQIIKEWIPNQPFDMKIFPDPPEFASNTVSCIRHSEKLDKNKLKEGLRNRGYLMDGGYRKMSEEGLPTFRIPTMGDLTEDMLRAYLNHISELFKEQA